VLTRFLITGRRWFQTTYGNTYHSVQIRDLEKNEIISYIPFRYGYGDQYRQTAYDELVKLGLVVSSGMWWMFHGNVIYDANKGNHPEKTKSTKD